MNQNIAAIGLIGGQSLSRPKRWPLGLLDALYLATILQPKYPANMAKEKNYTN